MIRITKVLAGSAARAAAWIPDALLVGGASAVSYGASDIYRPAGYVTGGLFALFAGWILSRREK